MIVRSLITQSSFETDCIPVPSSVTFRVKGEKCDIEAAWIYGLLISRVKEVIEMKETKGAGQRKKYASSTDVARLAGVSQSAVSRTYRPGGVVSEELRKKVLAAAAKLDYRPSMIPRIMLTERSNLIAVVVGGLYNPFNAKVLECFTIKLQDAGYQTLLVHVNSGYSLDEAIPRLASYRVDGVVSALAVLSEDSAAELERFKVPVVLFNATLTNRRVSSVSCDNRSAARKIADHFIVEGFRTRLAERGFDLSLVAGDGFTYESGYDAAAGIFGAGPPPDAIFCADDLIAIGAIDAARAASLSVPGDVMIAGFDDIPSASWRGYQITTFEQDADRMVDEALMILQQFSGEDSSVHGARKVVSPKLIERGTTVAQGEPCHLGEERG
ncbi:MAG: LacI family DNA-binding transcriptional regulator [Rhizobium pusense]|nr:LacI family DNA-binding transcriptional regulator [Agrobacterium pusense]